MRLKIKGQGLLLLLFFIFTLAGTARADTGPSNEPVVVRTLEKASGEVTAISAHSISFLYARTENAEYEKYLPLDNKVKLDRYRNFSEIKKGDRIEIEYEKVVESPKTPEMRTTMAVKTIRFVKRPREGELRSEEKG